MNKQAILVPIKCETCGTILDYMNINQVPENIAPEFKEGKPKVIRCPKCGDGVMFIVAQSQFDKTKGGLRKINRHERMD